MARLVVGIPAFCRSDIGAIAQLGERVVRNDEVGGSIPPGSTSLRSLRELRLGKPGKSLLAKSAKAASSKPVGRRRAKRLRLLRLGRLRRSDGCHAAA